MKPKLNRGTLQLSDKMLKLLTVFLFIPTIFIAQDLHFSQTAQTPLLINPGATGVFNGWERAIINQRNQWMGATTKFTTTNVSADVNILKDELNPGAYLGLGVMFYNDIGGDGNFGNQNGSLTLSGIIPTDKGSTFSMGIQTGFGSRKGDIQKLRFENQWDGEKFDETILSGESNNVNSFAYFDGSAGFYYVYDSKKNTFARNESFKLEMGLAAYHINQPTLKYNGISADKLYRKYVGHASIIKEIVNSPLAIDASVIQFIQGPHYETIFGAMLRYRFQNGTKITGLNQDAYFGFGMYARLKDAIIPTVNVDYKGFKFGISYDITVSALRRASYGGSLEFSLSFTNLNHALFKGRRSYHK